VSGKAADTYRRRVAAGLCRDCGRPRGDDGNATRCEPCARAVAAEKRQRRAINAIRVLFGIMSEEAMADRAFARRPLRLLRGGRIRTLRTESGRVVTHEDVLRALLAAYNIHLPPRPKRRR